MLVGGVLMRNFSFSNKFIALALASTMALSMTACEYDEVVYNTFRSAICWVLRYPSISHPRWFYARHNLPHCGRNIAHFGADFCQDAEYQPRGKCFDVNLQQHLAAEPYK